ncbi:MAG: hypothetical protein U9N46_01200 [Euryarchaeota archaeon]|nr:hypothetical protein [Euryarchaeota archaeon]
MKIRFYIDPKTKDPHIHRHEVTEHEVEDVLSHPGEDRIGHEGTRVAIGPTRYGRYLRVIYVPEPEGIFVITAYDLSGKALIAYRRRMRRRRK